MEDTIQDENAKQPSPAHREMQ